MTIVVMKTASERRAAGLCGRCGLHPFTEGYASCESCRARQNEYEKRTGIRARRRKQGLAARTIGARALERESSRDVSNDVGEPLESRPRTRAECMDGERPCLFVSCRHHLYVDVSPKGGLKLNFPDLEVDGLTETCALDVADRGGSTLEEVGALMNLTRERVRQIEQRALKVLEGRERRSLRMLVELPRKSA